MKSNDYIENNREETIKPKKEKTKRKRSEREKKASKNVSQIMSGEFLTKDFVVNNLNFIFFVLFLLILTVSKGYYVRQLSQNIRAEEKSLQDITADYVGTKAKLEKMTRRSEMVKKLAPMGLTETLNPTKVIRIKSKENKAK